MQAKRAKKVQLISKCVCWLAERQSIFFHFMAQKIIISCTNLVTSKKTYWSSLRKVKSVKTNYDKIKSEISGSFKPENKFWYYKLLHEFGQAKPGVDPTKLFFFPYEELFCFSMVSLHFCYLQKKILIVKWPSLMQRKKNGEKKSLVGSTPGSCFRVNIWNCHFNKLCWIWSAIA